MSKTDHELFGIQRAIHNGVVAHLAQLHETSPTVGNSTTSFNTRLLPMCQAFLDSGKELEVLPPVAFLFDPQSLEIVRFCTEVSVIKILEDAVAEVDLLDFAGILLTKGSPAILYRGKGKRLCCIIMSRSLLPHRGWRS